MLEKGKMVIYNVCPAEKRTKRSSILLLRLVRFSAGQTLRILFSSKIEQIPHENSGA